MSSNDARSDTAPRRHPDTWWTDMRWKVSVRLLRYALRIAPDGSAANDLEDHILDWSAMCRVAWHKRYPHPTQGVGYERDPNTAPPAWANPDHPGNRVRPLVRCIGCGTLGCITAWGPWCFGCNVPRMTRLSASFDQLAADYGIKSNG